MIRLGTKTYGDLVQALMKEDVLPLALHRQVIFGLALMHDPSTSRQNHTLHTFYAHQVKLARGVEMEYVYTNPAKHCQLQATDTIFALVHDHQD
jgi:hypothetical protein